MQTELLASEPGADIHVYAVWMPLTRTDMRSAWNPNLLPDKRVTHYWDEDRISGYWFSEHVSHQQPLAWDAYFLYDADATWDDVPSPLIGTGYTIIANAKRLQAEFSAFDWSSHD